MRLAKLRVKQIWGQLAEYANADLSTDDAKVLASGLREFTSVVKACMNWAGLVGGESADFEIFKEGSAPGNVISVVISDDDEFALCRDVMKGLSPEVGGKEYHQDIRHVLAWIADPSRNATMAERALTFLWSHGRENITVSPEVNKHFGKESPFFYFRVPTEYGSIVSPICKFILERIDRCNEAPDERDKIIPLGICEMPGCHRFMVIERRRRKRFCSDKCRVRFNQGPPSEYAAKMRSYRKGYNQTLKAMSRRPIRLNAPMVKGNKRVRRD